MYVEASVAEIVAQIHMHSIGRQNSNCTKFCRRPTLARSCAASATAVVAAAASLTTSGTWTLYDSSLAGLGPAKPALSIRAQGADTTSSLRGHLEHAVHCCVHCLVGRRTLDFSASLVLEPSLCTLLVVHSDGCGLLHPRY